LTFIYMYTKTNIDMENLITSTDHLIWRVKNVEGFDQLNVSDEVIFDIALEENRQLTDEWPEGEGFGSSDYSFLIKSVIDGIIMWIYPNFNNRPFETVFNPRHTVVKK